MSSRYEDAAKNEMLNHLATFVGYASLHSAYPATAANELAGGDYARQQVTWGSASGGEVEASNKPEFSVPGGKTVAAVGFFSHATGGTLYGSNEVTAETYANDGTYRIESAKMDLNG